ERTGAIAAAATTSLPEWIGGERNWDYRYSWIRDSVFAVRALHQLGFTREADRFACFIQRSAGGDAEQLQTLFCIDGHRRSTEVELAHLSGYRGSRPVRIGNAAATQLQLDAYGELLELAWLRYQHGRDIAADWDFLADIVDVAARRWREPDYGIWEVRNEPQHFVFSKALCWVALQRGIQLAESCGLKAPLAQWRQNRDAIRHEIQTEGYDAKLGCFRQAYGNSKADASLLLLPWFHFVPYDDPRMLRTTEHIAAELDQGGLIRRYDAEDGLRGPEGVFLPCTFWLVDCLARQGRTDDARRYYDRASACANDLGIHSEEFDVDANAMLGNFAQGLTHESQIIARLALRNEPWRDETRGMRAAVKARTLQREDDGNQSTNESEAGGESREAMHEERQHDDAVRAQTMAMERKR
ncbi:MAG TPA: glycoside hydrolase family 15 protein, partial [Pseudomonadales bacterium]